MKIVMDLMRNIFIIMFICLVALEVIVLISLTTLYRIPLNKNQASIETASMNNTKEVLNSFNNIIQRKYYNMETDLLLIAKHMYPMFLSQMQFSVDYGYPSYSKTSKFYNSYGNCLINGNEFNSTSNLIELEAKNTGINLMNQIFLKYNNFKNSDEEEIINALFDENQLNKIIFYPDYSFQDFYDVKFMEKYVCYAISIFKTILIRNTVFEKSNLIIDRFFLFLNNKFIYQYPLEYLNKNTYTNLNYFNSNITTCFDDYNNYSECFSTFTNPNSITNKIPDADIIFDSPLRKNDGLFSRGCIKVAYTEGNNQNFACIDFNLSKMLKEMTDTEDMNFFLISYDTDKKDFVFYFSNTIHDNILNYTKYDGKNGLDLGKYLLNENSTSFSLFHAVYNDLFDYDSLSSDLVKDIIAEYEEIVTGLKTIYDNYEKNKTSCDNYLSYDQNMSKEMHFLFKEQLINMNISKNKINLF